MPNRVIEVRVTKRRKGVTVDGITRSDRGTKYVVNSEFVEYAGLSKAQQLEAIKKAAEKVLGI